MYMTMQEDFLHYIWKYGLYASRELTTDSGEPVSILRPGQLNRDAGPDFLYARIRIGEQIWVGHVEIHVRGSDWFRHRHHLDPAFESVVLHVVHVSDVPAVNCRGHSIPTLPIPVKACYLKNYHRLLSTFDRLPCGHSISTLPSMIRVTFLERMGIERLEQRTGEIELRLQRNRGRWPETLLQLFFRSYGFGVNQEAFDTLAGSIPFLVLERSRSNLFALEALLFGQARLLPESGKSDPYVVALIHEYHYLLKKYNLRPPPYLNWRFLRMRPMNFPTIRIALLAAFLHNQDNLMDTVIRGRGLMPGDHFDVPPSSYWRTHYDFHKPSSFEIKSGGLTTRNLIIINALLPFWACYAHQHGIQEARQVWMESLINLPAEQNRIIRIWSSVGLNPMNAFETQGLYYAFRSHCANRRCLTCLIGQYLVRGGE